eukprot:995359-Rhodomonas_salina.4
MLTRVGRGRDDIEEGADVAVLEEGACVQALLRQLLHRVAVPLLVLLLHVVRLLHARRRVSVSPRPANSTREIGAIWRGR